MYTSRMSNQSNRFMDTDQQLRSVEIPCRYHPGSICLIYCTQTQCYKFLCEECLEEHLAHHKNNSMNPTSLKSLKKVRQICVDKLNKLIEELLGRMQAMKQPKTPQQIIQQVNIKFEGIKKIMFEIIEQELNKFSQQLRAKVNQSFSTIKNLQQIHKNLTDVIMSMQQSKNIIIDGTKQISQAISQTLALQQNVYLESFAREAAQYMQKLSYIDFDISLNQNKFRNLVSQCLKINRHEYQEGKNNQYGKYNQLGTSRALSSNPNTINTPANRNRSKSQNIEEAFHGGRQIVQMKIQSGLKYLHFFQSGSSCLHLIDINNPYNIRKQTVSLNNYVVPDFHASVLISQGYIFISGGIIEIGDMEMKHDRLSRFSLKAKGSDNFKKDFAKVKARSSHSLCQYGDYIYILGGYGQAKKDQLEAQKTVERVNIRSAQIDYEPKSKYGGANISLAINDSIVKASEQGVQVYNINAKKWSTVSVSENYAFMRGCGWTKVSKDCVFIYGGYDDKENGIDTCKLWSITQNDFHVKNLGLRLPHKEGFLNSPGVIVDGLLYVIQNMATDESEEREESILGIREDQRALLCFDGNKWKQITMKE